MARGKKKLPRFMNLEKSQQKSSHRVNKGKRKRRVSDVEEAPNNVPVDVPEDITTEIANNIVTQSKSSDNQTAGLLPNHTSSASPKRNNGFESQPTNSNGKIECTYLPERDTSSVFNRLGYSEDVLSALPNRTWAIHCVEIPEKRIVVSSMIMQNLHGTGMEPLYIKQIIFDEKLNFDLFLINTRVVLKDKPSTIETIHDFEDLVDYIESLKICEGGPAVSQYSNVHPECAYKDPLNKWRHNLCSLEMSVGNVCESCSSLDEILRRQLQRIKPSVKVRTPILLPKRKNRLRD